MSESLKAKIRQKALELGFSELGFAPAVIPPTASALTSWLEQGNQATMNYLARDPERRQNPQQYWPAARSLLIVSAVYYSADPAESCGPLEGVVARYARGIDYHDRLLPALMALGRYVADVVPGTTFRAVVDTAAVLERAHAVAAGLGWFGKNSMLLSRTKGSYTLLGVLLVDCEIAPDNPATAHCGSCRQCIDACPTQAITAPGRVDGRRCISYLTIELRGAMDREIRAGVGNRIFGCDICQEVCPWVKHAQTTPASPLLNHNATLARLSLTQLLLESPEQFSQQWRGYPQKRARREGLARNAAVALGNSADRDGAVSTLEGAIDDASTIVRGHVAWALGVQGGARAKQCLERVRLEEPDESVREEIELALETASGGGKVA